MPASKLQKSVGNKALPPNAGKGRKKGVPNRVTKELKEMILGALSDVGGQDYLARQAEENPNAYLALVGKVLPMTVSGTGEKGEIKIVVSTGINRDDD
jgi:hypothetical protein